MSSPTVTGRFYDMIISILRFHDGLETSSEAAQTLIRGVVRHLNSGGELRIVANALPYPNVLDEIFGFHGSDCPDGPLRLPDGDDASGGNRSAFFGDSRRSSPNFTSQSPILQQSIQLIQLTIERIAENH